MLQIISGDSLLTFIHYSQYLLTNLAFIGCSFWNLSVKKDGKRRQLKKWMRKETIEG